jgi:hypothetical protein
MAVSFHLHDELHILASTTQLVKDTPQLLWSVGPHRDGVVHTTKLPEGLMSVIPPMNKLATTGESGEAIAIPSVCSLNKPPKQ